VVDLVDEEGRVVRSLAIKVDRSGRGRATWDGKDASGRPLPPGVYRHFVRVSDGEGREGQDETAAGTGGQELATSAFTFERGTPDHLRFVLPQAGWVRVRADLQGFPHLRTLLDWKPLVAGEHVIPWDGKDASGKIALDAHPALSIVLHGYSMPWNAVILEGEGAARAPVEQGQEPLSYPPLAQPEAAYLHARHEVGRCRELKLRIELPPGPVQGVVPVRVLLDPEDCGPGSRQPLSRSRSTRTSRPSSRRRTGPIPSPSSGIRATSRPASTCLTVNLFSYDDHFGVATVPWSWRPADSKAEIGHEASPTGPLAHPLHRAGLAADAAGGPGGQLHRGKRLEPDAPGVAQRRAAATAVPARPQPRPPRDKTDPVDLQRGDFLLTRQDVFLPGRIPVDVTFTYRSRSSVNGPYGYGWDMSYHRRVRKLLDGNVVVLRGNGERESWTYQAGAYVPATGVLGSLTREGNGTWTRKDLHGTTESYDVQGNLAQLADRNGNALTFTYDPAGRLPVSGGSDFFVTQTSGVIQRDYRLTRISDPLGRNVDLGYDGTGRLASLSWAARTITYGYEPNGDLTSVTTPSTSDVPSGATTHYGYQAHNLTSVTDPKGQAYLVNEYDSFDCVTRQTYGGFPATMTYRNSASCPEIDRGGTSGYLLTAKPLLASPGGTLKVSWSVPVGGSDTVALYRIGTNTQVGSSISTGDSMLGSGTITIPTLAAADLYELRYIHSGTSMAHGNSVRVATAQAAPETEVTDRRGNTSLFQFDPAGHVTQHTVLTDGVPAGEPASYVTRTTYDAKGMATRIEHPRGNATEYRYDSLGNLTQVREKVIGGPPGVDSPSDLVTQYSYEPQFNLLKTMTDPNSRVTTFTYDYELGEPLKGNLRRITLPNVGAQTAEVQLTYTANGQINSITDPVGNVSRFIYDSVTGLPSTVTRGYGTPKEASVVLGYDAVGNVSSLRDPNGTPGSFTSTTGIRSPTSACRRHSAGSPSSATTRTAIPVRSIVRLSPQRRRSRRWGRWWRATAGSPRCTATTHSTA
jgi:YD repeat-containing protein